MNSNIKNNPLFVMFLRYASIDTQILFIYSKFYSFNNLYLST